VRLFANSSGTRWSPDRLARDCSVLPATRRPALEPFGVVVRETRVLPIHRESPPRSTSARYDAHLRDPGLRSCREHLDDRCTPEDDRQNFSGNYSIGDSTMIVRSLGSPGTLYSLCGGSHRSAKFFVRSPALGERRLIVLPPLPSRQPLYRWRCCQFPTSTTAPSASSLRSSCLRDGSERLWMRHNLPELVDANLNVRFRADTTGTLTRHATCAEPSPSARHDYGESRGR